MIRTGPWQSQAVLEVQNILVTREDVIALALFGSATQSGRAADEWSDLDVLLVLEDHAYSQFYPSVAWLGGFGEIFAVEQSENSFHSTSRICFSDFRRIDFVITTESKIRQIEQWHSIPFWRGAHVLVSRSEHVTQLLSRDWSPPALKRPSPADFQALENHFWFKAMLAGYKVLRNDRLIALHLTLDLVRDCCVLGMMLRDRTTGTNIHPEGGMGNLFVDDLQDGHAAYTSAGILTMIERSAIQFDRLAQEWSDGYRAKRAPLLEWIEKIRLHSE